MFRYILKKAAYEIFLILMVILLLFIIFNSAPGGIEHVIFGE